jgi:hypothetical protein
MPTLIFIALVALVSVAGLVTYFAFRQAELGYEDESGFHFGSPPEKRPGTAFVQSVLIYHRGKNVQGTDTGRNKISHVPSARSVGTDMSPRSSNRA